MPVFGGTYLGIRRHWQSWLLVICEVAVAIGTIAALIISGQQAKDLHRQTELQNRPFLSFLPTRFAMRFDGPGETENEVWCDLVYQLKNVGPVPAFNTRIEKFDIEVNRGGIPKEAIPTKTEFVAVFPGDPLYEKRRFTLDRQIAREYYNGTQHFRVHAKVSYRSVESAKENPYWFEVSAESIDFSGFTLLRTDGN